MKTAQKKSAKKSTRERKDIYFEAPGPLLAKKVERLPEEALPIELRDELLEYLNNSKSTAPGRPKDRQDLSIADTNLEEEYQTLRASLKAQGVKGASTAALKILVARHGYTMAPGSLANKLSEARPKGPARKSKRRKKSSKS